MLYEKKNLIHLSLYLLSQVSEFLDIRSFVRLCMTCKLAKNCIFNDECTWRKLLLRDFKEFLQTLPLEEELALQKHLSRSVFDRLKPINDQADEAAKDFYYRHDVAEKFKNYVRRNEDEVLQQAQKQPQQQYKKLVEQLAKAVQFQGLFLGDYASHGLERIRMEQFGYRLFAVKETGDVNVPAGKITFEVLLSSSLQRGEGRIHLAESGFQQPRWGYCQLRLKSRNQLVVTWLQDNAWLFGEPGAELQRPIVAIPLCLWRGENADLRFSEQMSLVRFDNEYSDQYSVICYVNF